MKKIVLPLLMVSLAILPFNNLLSQTSELLVKDYISTQKLKEYKKQDLTHYTIDVIDTSTSLKGDIIKLQQTYRNLPIYNTSATALIKNSKVSYFVDNFIKDYKTSSTIQSPRIDAQLALTKIADKIGKESIKTYPILDFTESEGERVNFAKQRLVYANDNGNLLLSYEFLLPEIDSPNYWNFLVNAENGDIIAQYNLNLSCTFKHDAYSYGEEGESHYHNFVGPVNQTIKTNLLLAPDAASYNVFPLPIEAPSFGARSVVTNPWILSSSPEGWHFDGTTRYTNTRGNNVFAYADTAGNNGIGFNPDGGSSRNFNYPYSNTGLASNNQSAAVTNLFYMSNMMHDIFYKFGFTERFKNFQQSNFGLGGSGNDYVNAEAQDGGGTNNANFASPADGSKPRMQMYLWTTVNKYFFYNTPTSASNRSPSIGTATYGTALTPTGVTGNVQLASVLNGCTALPAGSLSGKIGLIERGDCNFVVKSKIAQNAGATAVIIYNNTANGNTISNMSGTDSTVNIPSVLISNTEGEYIKSLLRSNTVVNVTLKNDPSTAITPDGSFDNGIIAHEYGHGISNRMTGTGYNCLNSSLDFEQMGEGWSDFFALMLTNRVGDNASVPRGIGTYAVNQATSGGGIRPARYSPNRSINGYNYGDTNGMEYSNGLLMVPDVHSIGFIWASMLWDLHWNYAEKYGYAADVTANPMSGSARVLQLITDALKLQGCNPSFVDGRNAILAAEMATTNGADKCMIWRTFANRGLGVLADPGILSDINDQFQDFTVPSECALSTDEVKGLNTTLTVYPNPAKNEFFVNFPSNIMGKVNLDIYDMAGKLVQSQSKITPDSQKVFSTEKLQNGVYIIKVNGIGVETSTKLIIKK